MDFSHLTVKDVLELGAYGSILVAFLFDRLVLISRRETREANRLDKVIAQFREERKEDRVVLLKLAQAVSKLEAKLDGDAGGRSIDLETSTNKE